MKEVKLPESFKKLSFGELYSLIDKFIQLNKNIIPPHQIKNWIQPKKFRHRVPMLFMLLVKSKGFEFSKKSEPYIKQFRCPEINYLLQLNSKSEREKQEMREKLRQELIMGAKRKKRINSRMFSKVYKCSNNECINNNLGSCSIHPLKPSNKGGVVTDCDRFKVKNWNKVLDMSLER